MDGVTFPCAVALSNMPGTQRRTWDLALAEGCNGNCRPPERRQFGAGLVYLVPYMMRAMARTMACQDRPFVGTLQCPGVHHALEPLSDYRCSLSDPVSRVVAPRLHRRGCGHVQHTLRPAAHPPGHAGVCLGP